MTNQLFVHTCVYSLVSDEVRLELGGEATEVTQVWADLAVGDQVLTECVPGGKPHTTLWAREVLTTCNHLV